jgi:peptidoglycan/LPS O-acetylase OafA/YrhL
VSHPLSARSSGRVNVLDFLRFAGAALVLAAHYTRPEQIGSALHAAISGGVGSTFFFLLSGFLLVGTSTYSKESWAAFATSRISRIYPLHLVCTLVYLPFHLLGSDRMGLSDLGLGLFSRLFALDAVHVSYLGGASWDWNGPAWSVTVLLFGGLLLPVLKSLTLPHVRAGVVFSSLVALWALRLGMTMFPPLVTDQADLFSRHSEPVAHILEVLLGGMFAIFLSKVDAQRLRSLFSGDIALVSALFLIAVPLGVAAATGGRVGSYYFIHGPVLPFMLLFLVAAQQNAGKFAQYTRARWTRVAAEASLPLFLLHAPVGRFTKVAFLRAGLLTNAQADSWIGTALALCLLLPLVFCSIPILERTRQFVFNVLTPAGRPQGFPEPFAPR